MARKAEVIFVGDAASLVSAALKSKAAIKAVQDQAGRNQGLTDLERKAQSATSALEGLPKAGGGITSALLAATPVVTGLTGALGALAASATAAAGGAGAVAVGGVGALAVGLGSIAAVAAPAVSGFKNVTTALDEYTLAVQAHGKAGEKTATALTHLNAVVAQSGGAPVLAAVKAWNSLGDSFQKLTGPATSTMFKTLNDGLTAIKSDLPTVAGIANKSMTALSNALQVPFKMLSSPEFKSILTSLGDTFSKSIGPAIKAATDVFMGFARVAQAAGPYVVQLAHGLQGLAGQFLAATANPQKLSGIIGGLVSQTKSWIALGGALTRLIFDVFKQGASSGQGMVDSLTTIVNKWGAWARSAGGSRAITNFFQQSAQFLKELGGALLPVVHAFSVMSNGLLPTYVSLMSKLKGIMGPLTYAFVAYKGALLVVTPAIKAFNAAAKVQAELMGRTAPGAGIAPRGTSGAAGAAGAEGNVGMGLAREGFASTLTKAMSGLAIGTIGVAISQAVGSGIHNGVGSAIKSIGTDASIGAGMGAMFGPEGIAGGAIVGGMVGAFKHFVLDDAPKEGQEFANKFLAPMPKAVQDKFAKPLADATNKLNAALAKQRIDASGGGARAASADKARGAPLETPAQSAADDASTRKAYFDKGYNAGEAIIAGLNSVKTITTPVLLSDFTRKLDELPAKARPEAAKVMLQFAQGLAQQGKLPQSALATIITGLTKQFPGMAVDFGNGSKKAVQAVVDNLKFTAATNTLKNTLAGYRKDFGDWSVSTQLTAANLNSNIKTAMDHLHATIKDSSGQTRKDAIAEYDKLRDGVVGSFSTMGEKVSSSAQAMQNSIQKNLKGAAQSAVNNFGNFQDAVTTAMSAGVLTTGQGAQLITKALNQTLSAFGAKQLPIPALIKTESTFRHGGTGGSSNRGSGFGHTAASGGLFQVGRPGDAGHDNVPVNAGGTPITVGSGEQVAVFNRHQLPIVNSALAGVGGLPGLFDKVRTPHYMARGGMVPARYAGGGNVWAVRTSQEAAASGTGYTELSPNGNAAAKLGIPHSFSNNPAHYPDFASLGQFYGQTAHSGGALPLKIRNGSKSGIWKMTDYGDGSSYAPAIGLTPAVTAVLGPAGGTMEITRADGGDLHLFPGMGTLVSGSGGFAAAGPGGVVAKPITGPTVKGTGTMATIVRAAVGMMTKAATAYAQAHQPVTTGGGGGVGPVFPVHGGKVPAQVQVALQAAQAIAARSPAYGHMGAGWGLPAYDCSSYVSTVMDAAGIWPKWVYYTAAGPINEHTEPGPGKWITIATRGTSGDNAHTMMEIDGHYFESSHTGLGPHVDSGWSEAFTWYRHPKGFAVGGMAEGQPGHQVTQAQADTISRGGAKAKALIKKLNPGLPFAGSFKDGGTVPGSPSQASLAVLHGQETVTPYAGGGIVDPFKHPSRGSRTATGGLLYPIDAAIAAIAARLTQLQGETAPNHNREISRLEADLTKVQGKKKTAATVGEEKTLQARIRLLKQEDDAAKKNLATQIKLLTNQENQLTKLNAYKTTIQGLRSDMKGLAEQAAQVWSQKQTDKINAAHDAAITAANNAHDAATAAIASGPAAQQLAALQAQDAAEQDQQTTDQLNKQLAADQATAAHSGGQTHTDALAAVQQDQQAIADYQRQKQEQTLQDQINTAQTNADNQLTIATKSADDQQTVQLNALTKQTADYQSALEKQLSALTDNLNKRKITYAEWAKDVNKILSQAGLSEPTDPNTEATITAGPGTVKGNGGTKKGPHITDPFRKKKPKKGGGRATGGPVLPGYVYRVGEQGPEDVMFGQPGTVMSASQTRRGGGPAIHIEKFVANSAQAVRSFADRLAFRAAIGTA